MHHTFLNRHWSWVDAGQDDDARIPKEPDGNGEQSQNEQLNLHRSSSGAFLSMPAVLVRGQEKTAVASRRSGVPTRGCLPPVGVIVPALVPGAMGVCTYQICEGLSPYMEIATKLG